MWTRDTSDGQISNPLRGVRQSRKGREAKKQKALRETKAHEANKQNLGGDKHRSKGARHDIWKICGSVWEVELSKPRYDWWPYAKGMIRRYPALREKYADLHSTTITPSYSGMPGGGGDGRTVERTIIRELPSTEQREYEAVRRAIATTERYRDGLDRLKIIKMMYWDKTHTMEGAALMIPCSIATAKRWNGEFVRLVASYYGLMD